MKKIIFAFISSLLLISPFFAKAHPAEDAVKQNIIVEPVKGITEDFIRGVDISSLSDIEKAGGKFYNDDGKEEDLFKILKDHGVNWIRLRVWNNPVNGGGSNSVETDIPLAKRAKDAGFNLLIDFHYSDFWADPAKQYMPEEWKGLNEKQLNAAVETFTRESLKKFIAAGARPDMVQIGNELNNGFMWPLGKIWGDKGEKVGGFEGFTKLLQSASRGVRSAQGSLLDKVLGKDQKIKIVVHLADGCDNGLYHTVFDQVTKAKIDFDVIGLSYYNYWHGSTAQLKQNMNDLSKVYGKELCVMETAYAFTEDDGDAQGNVFQIYSGENEGYLPSVQGQATAIRDVMNVVAAVPNGLGVFYWEPAWIPVKGAGLSKTEGDTWENQGMFDFKGRALPSLSVWNLAGGKGQIKNAWGGSASNGSGFLPYALGEPIEVTTTPGKEPELPKFAKVLFTNDKENKIQVVWEKHDWKSEKKANVVYLKGVISGTDFTPVAKVTVSTRVNLVEDNSFESGKLGKWTLDGDPAACFIEDNKGNAHSGKYTYKYWLGKGFKSTLSQTFTGLENGEYEASIWAMGGGGENEISLRAVGFDGNKLVKTEIVNTGWKNWKQYKIKIPVKEEKLTLQIFLDTNNGNWGNFDDVELYKVE
ncbi:Arabinogalactan endo-1,4-beta-galactosidase [Treponema sp. JC4]|uniref:glycosyl hydrolase 53 family protein n=1 Tax=Treponema sp. JC4 TaxID=1124982 RepID=UPI00025B0293|nr:glycosyl hydrolase 53 family protein [Treponema sp. JC4]EID86337.1 Arabinogalactan endo-1,4-beta-galactosidase [Treponema sp. JC4]